MTLGMFTKFKKDFFFGSLTEYRDGTVRIRKAQRMILSIFAEGMERNQAFVGKFRIDGHVHLVRSDCSQTDNFRLFLHQQTDK
jgi:hypothetical protein